MSSPIHVNYLKENIYAENAQNGKTVYLVKKIDTEIWIVDSERKHLYLEYENNLQNPYYWGD